MSALDKQVAGDHYKKGKIQPIELTYMLGQTPAFCKVCKYTTRVKDDTLQQLEKAMHCIELDEELQQHHYKYRKLHNKKAFELIDQFTEVVLLRQVLKHMHSGDYSDAKLGLALIMEDSEDWTLGNVSDYLLNVRG